ncbi:MAG: hydantoinase B/oxoprolinase family protein, partial [Betaproteobacteria bacterium]|nr:hydantoinase B/oxoprolinase family protein [Betaproteobacteria bacterium]
MNDAISTEVIGSALTSVADEVYTALVKSAYSANIKERQDCSAAIIDAAGRVAAISDMSIPIHLGSFSLTGAALLERFPDIVEGDVYVVNDPYSGGPSHLADVTFISPVFCDGALVAFVANVGHWPDVGGKAPGQCSLGDGTEVFQEGLRIPPMRLYEKGVLLRDKLEIILCNVRDPDDRMGDIRAHIGCLRLGERRVLEIATRHGAPALRHAIDDLARASEIRIRHAILNRLDAGVFEAIDYLDDDLDSAGPIPLKVKVTVTHTPEPSVTVDFTGTAPAIKLGMNCPYQGTQATVYWVMRSILDPSIPPNDGFSRPLHIVAPQGSIVCPVAPSPVGARYQVVSQLVDLISHALASAVRYPSIEAGSNGVHGIGFSSRNPRFIYYETVAGGSGGRSNDDGIDCVHTTSNMPIEAMESEFPIMADRLEYLVDSGGPGRFRGGLGVRKDYCALVPLFAAVQSNRHHVPGPGLFGG